MDSNGPPVKRDELIQLELITQQSLKCVIGALTTVVVSA